MRKNEIINLIQYLIFHQQKLKDVVIEYDNRFLRRNLDSLDLLEEIIAKERLNEFEQVTEDILRILRLSNDEISYVSICVKCANNLSCKAQECEKVRDIYTHFVVDCLKFQE